MLRDAVLDAVILLFVIQTNDCVLNVLMPVVVDRLMSWKNGLMLEALFLNIYFYKYKNVKVQLIHFSSAFPICQVAFVVILDVGIASICASFDKFLLFSLLRMGTLRDHSCYFLFLRIIYEYYKAQSAIKLFQLNEFF